MKWWKRMLRKRVRKTIIFPKWKTAFRILRFLYRMAVRSQVMRDSVRRWHWQREANMLLELFGKLRSK
jgi:hypothetical protein